MVQTAPPPRPVTDDDRGDLVLPIVGGLKDLVFGSPGLFLDRPAFVAGPTPDSAIGQAVQGITRVNCRIWASNDKSNYSTRVNAGNAEICGPYLDAIDEKPDEGDVGPPFSGGQCPVAYRASVTATAAFNDCTTGPAGNPDVGLGFGPILGLEYSTQEAGLGGQPLCEGFSYNLVSFRTPSGVTPLIGQGRGIRLESFSVRREDGQPDNCGQPAPVIRPPSTVTPVTPIDPRVPIFIPGFGDTNVDVDLSNDGDIILNFPDLPITVEVNPDGGEGGGSGGPPPGDIGDPGGGGDTGVGGEDTGEAPPGSVLTGVRVQILEFPESRAKFTDEVFRGAYYVYMGVPGLLDHDPAGAMATVDQFIFAEKDNLTAYRVRANNGYNIRVTPYYREVED